LVVEKEGCTDDKKNDGACVSGKIQSSLTWIR
jgi:hypothetical protein